MGELATFDAARSQHLEEPAEPQHLQHLEEPAEPQHLRALEHANHVRLARAALKRRICSGQASAADVVADPPPEAARMTISDLLMSQARWGHTRCRRMLVQMGIPETKHVGTLTLRQRCAIAEVLRGEREPVDRELPPPVRETTLV